MAKNRRSVFARIVIVVSIALGLTTCDAFKAGLGPKIDISAPTVDVSSIANGAYLRGTVSISGACADDVAVQSVSIIITIDSVQVATLPTTIKSGIWTASMDTKALSGGKEVQADLDIRVTDGSGKNTDKKLVVYFDNVAPVLTGLTPSSANLSSSDYALSEKTTITGSVKDGLGVAKTVLTVGDISLSDTTHPAAWSLVLDTAQFYDTATKVEKNGATPVSGLYKVGYSVISTDYAGNTSEPLTGVLYINPDGAPTVNVSDLTAGVNPSITYPRASSTVPPTSSLPSIVVPGSTFKLRVSDLDGIDTSQLYVVLTRGSDLTSGSTAAPTALTSSSMVYWYKASDKTLKEAILDSTTLSGGGTIPTRAEYSFTLPTSVGEYLLLIHAADYAANKISGVSVERYLPSSPSSGNYAYSSLYITNSTTNVTIDSPSEGGYSSGTLSAGGTASSDDGLDSVTLTIRNTDTATVLSTDTVTITGTPTTYTWAYPKSGLADGHYSIAAVAMNHIGKPSSAVSRNFSVDTSKPSATINALAGSQSGNIGISGASSDTGSGVEKIEYSLDSIVGPWTAAGGTSPWSGSLDLSVAAEGPHTLYARATDYAGNVTAQASYGSMSFDVDKANPQATETSHGAALVQSAAAVGFAGQADDAAVTAGRQATKAVLSYSKDGAAATSLTLTATGSTGGFAWNQTTGAWSWTLPAPGDHSGDGLYTITLAATDSASKTASVTRTAQIDTTPPTLVVSAPLANESTTSSGYTISGTSRDTGGVGFSGTNDVEYNLNGVGWTSVALTGTNWSSSVALGPSEGAQTLAVRSTDRLGNQASSGTLNFFYDLSPPTMAETWVAGVGNPATFSMSTNATIAFAGTVSDTDALAAIHAFQVSIDGGGAVDASSLGAPYTYTGPESNWHLSVLVGGAPMADGTHTFVFTAKDIAGKTTSVTRTVIVDTTKPVAVINTPSSLPSSNPAYWLSGPTASIGGTASDSGSGASGVANVYYTTAAKGAGQPAFSTSTWTLAAGAANWNGTIKLTGAGSIGEGEFTLYVAAVDAVGNIQTPTSRDFGVDQSDPTVSEGHSASSATKLAFTLSGSIGDTNALAALTVTEKKGASAPESVTIAAPAIVSGTGPTAWSTISLPIHGLTDGSYLYTITVTDVAGKTSQLTRTVKIDLTPPTVAINAIPAWISGSAYTVSGTGGDPIVSLNASGVSAIANNLDGAGWTNAAWVDTSGGANTSGTWSATLTGLTEGSHSIQVQATDAAANACAPVLASFGVDFSPPSLSETAIGVTSIVYKNSSFSLSGSASDTNAMAASNSLQVSIDGQAAVNVTALSGKYAGTFVGTAWTISADTSGGTLDGVHTYVITATDVAGKQTAVTRTAFVDTAAPTMTVNAPGASTWIDGVVYAVKGIADDGTGSGVDKVYFRIDDAATDHSTDDPTTWTLAGGTVSWSSSVNFSALAEGNKKLWVKSVDKAGNWNASATTVLFGVDKNPPSLGETAINTTTQVNRAASFVLSGPIGDSNPDGAAGLSLSLSVDGGAAAAVTFAGATYSKTVTVDTAGHADDGNHTYTLVATDIAGKTTTVVRKVHIDTTAPVSVFGNIASNGSTVILDGVTTKITGTISDATAVASATSTIQFSPDYGTTWNAVESGASLGSPSGTSWNFSKDLTGAAFSADGMYRSSITAADSLGNSLATMAINFYLDRTNPVVSLAALANAFLNQGFTVTGSASSANLSGVSWWIDGNIPTALPGPFVPGSPYALNIPISAAAIAALSEGSHSVTVQAQSSGGRQAQAVLNFTVDRTAPANTFNNISAAGGTVIQAASPQVIGTATDATGILEVDRRIEHYNGATWDLTSDFAAMGSASGTNYTWTADLSNTVTYPDGQYRITIRTIDRTAPANSATGSSVMFYIDRAAPTAAIASPASGGAYYQGFAVSGTAADANLTSVVAKLDGSTALTVAGTAAWSTSLTTPQVQALSEGPHSITVVATDVAGNSSATQTLAFRMDHSAPAITWSNISGGGGTVVQDAAPKIGGTLSDASGIATGTATLERYDFATATWSVLAGWNAASLGVGGNPTTFPWSVDISNSVTYPDGRYRITIASSDIASPANSVGAGPVVFMLSRANPVAAVIGPSMGSYQNATPVFWGSASDANGVTAVIAKAATGGTVDFGSGTTNAIAGLGAALDPATDVFTTATTNGLVNGDLVYLSYASGGALPSATGTAIASATGYYAVSATATTFKLSLTSGGAAIDFTTAGTGLIAASSRFSFGGTSVYWMVPALSLGGAPDGTLTAYAQVTAGSAKTQVASRDFTLDKTSPAIAISTPSVGTRSVGNLAIVGTSTDPGSSPSGVTGGIQYQIGKNASLGNPASWTNANVSGGAYSWTINLGTMSPYANATYATQCDAAGNPSGAFNLWKLPIYFQATDNAGNVQQKTDYWLILDPDGNIPVVTLTQPTQNGLTYGGQQRITGTASQPVWVHDVEVAVDPAGGSNFPVNPVGLSISSSTLTSAGHPFTNGMTVFFAGTTMPQIGGTNVSATTPYFIVNAAANTFQVSAASGGAPVAFSANGSGVTASVWAPATLISTGNNVMWYYDINQGNYFPQGGASNQTVTIQVRAWNSPTAGGARGTISGLLSSSLSMKFDSTFPKIQGLEISPSNNYSDPLAKSYFSQITVAGSFYAMGYVVSSKGIAKIEKVEVNVGSGSTTLYDTSVAFGTTNTVIPDGTAHVTPPAAVSAGAFPNGGSYQLMITSLGTTDWNSLGFIGTAAVGAVFKPNGLGSGTGQGIPSDSSGNFAYLVSIPIASSSIYNGTSGVYAFDIRATDMTTPAQVSAQTVTLDEDNYYPNGSIASSSSIVGSQFVVQGSASDSGSGSGPISGFSKVVVYFVRAGSVLNLATGANGATSSMTAKDMNNGGTIGSVAYPGTGANLKLSIDSLAENNVLPTAGGTDSNGDGFMESLTINGSSYAWAGQIDSTKISDGPVEVHYVSFDAAGNATHYVQSAVVSNFAPKLNMIVLGTDMTGSGTVNTTTSFNSNFSATNFIVRNRLMSFQINSTYGGQNGALSYSLTNGGNQYWANAPASGETVSGVTANSATLTLDFTKLSPPIPDAAANGAAFTLTVTASPTAGGTQTYVQVVNLTIQNTDTTPPTIAIAPFGQRYNTPTDAGNGGVYTDTGKVLGPVSAYTDNVATSGATLLGHVEYATDSIFADSQPNLSGQVVFRGKVYDNQRISRITATIPNFDGGGGAGIEFEVAKWSGAALVADTGTNWAFATDSGSEGVSLPDGHVLNWGLTVDTSKLSTVAQKSLNVTFKVYDFMTTGTGASRSDTTHMTSAQLVGIAGIVNGSTPVYVYGGTTPTWTIISSYTSGTGAIVLASAVPTNNTSFIVANVASAPIAVDVVPYIANVTTALSSAYSSKPSALNRSASGTYPVREGETITLSGFNFNGTSTTVSLNGTSITPSAGSSTSLTLPLGTTALSGVMVVSVSAVSSANDCSMAVLSSATSTRSSTTTLTSPVLVGIPTATIPSGTSMVVGTTAVVISAFDPVAGTVTFAPSVAVGTLSFSLSPAAPSRAARAWNQLPNGLNNSTLVDDLKFAVWKFNSVLASTSARYPRMRVSPDAAQRVGFSYDSGAQEVHVNNNGADAKVDGSYTQWYDTGFAYDAAGNYYAVGVNGDSGGGGSGSYNATANSGFYAWQAGNATADGNGGTYTQGTYKVLFESAYNGTSFDSNRVQEPKIATSGAASPFGIYMTYWDNLQNQLRFRYGTVATGGVFSGALGNQPNSGEGSATGYQTIADTSTTANRAGVYSAVGVTSGGVAVIAWYDATNRSLVYSYNDNPTQTAGASVAATAMAAGKRYRILTLGTTNFTTYGASSNTVGNVFTATGPGLGTGTVTYANWQDNATVVDSDFAGWYVDLAVDAADHIHLAYYNASNGDLRYAYIVDYKSAASAKVAAVDSWLSTGSRISIAVKAKVIGGTTYYVPYISYYMASYTSTSFSVRVAWRTDADLTANGQGNPSNGASSDLFTGSWEVMSMPSSNVPKDFTVGIGFKTLGAAVNSPILGYATNAGLETAQLK